MSVNVCRATVKDCGQTDKEAAATISDRLRFAVVTLRLAADVPKHSLLLLIELTAVYPEDHNTTRRNHLLRGFLLGFSESVVESRCKLWTAPDGVK